MNFIPYCIMYLAFTSECGGIPLLISNAHLCHTPALFFHHGAFSSTPSYPSLALLWQVSCTQKLYHLCLELLVGGCADVKLDSAFHDAENGQLFSAHTHRPCPSSVTTALPSFAHRIFPVAAPSGVHMEQQSIDLGTSNPLCCFRREGDASIV